MNREHYEKLGREAYRNGRVIIPGEISPRFWQRRAFIAGYTSERAAWRARNPGADELGEAAKRNATWCKSMVGS